MAILEVDSVIKQFKQYDTTVTAVNRASIKIEEGEFIAIIGSSGSGKSTFLNLCAGLDVPNAGTIKIRGNDITKMKPDELSRFRGNFTGFIYQKHNLIPQLTAIENILIPTIMCNKEEFRYEEHLKKLIRVLDLADRLHHLPSELSGGQQQRVAIARAMINRPQILFADEPTGNLDRANADEVLQLLLATKEELGQTLLMVTHDLTIAEHADKIYKMDNGKLTLFKDKKGYRLNTYENEAKQAAKFKDFEIGQAPTLEQAQPAPKELPPLREIEKPIQEEKPAAIWEGLSLDEELGGSLPLKKLNGINNFDNFNLEDEIKKLDKLD